MDGVKRKDRDGIAHLELLTVECFSTDDVILILPPDMGWVAATLVGIFLKDS